jgi:uncharacterized protein (DUF2062 family)
VKKKIIKWRNRKIIIPFYRVLKEGISTEKLSISIALGMVLGLMPLYGFTTLLVGIVALILRLNFISMQIAHYIVSPIQLALIVPFFRLGDALFNASEFNYTISQYLVMVKTNFWHTIKELWFVNLSALFVWSVISIPLFIILYHIFKVVIGKYRLLLIRHKVA